MSQELFTETSLKCSRLITRHYSTSFSLGIKLFSPTFRYPIYGIYGFVRYADEIVDTFHDYNKQELLQRFRNDTYKAIEDKISLNPILNSFQKIVHEYCIEQELIDAFLDSMEMDLHDLQYNQELYRKYIYGSAEVVGLMCLKVFCERDDSRYQKLQLPARSLGAAFQKVNFLRDINSDFVDRGRTYFPGVNLQEFSFQDKAQIEADIQKDFEKAREGILELPSGAKVGVYLAYIYYLKLFKKIRRLEASLILSKRIRIPNLIKISLLLRTIFLSRLRVI
ncbi:MAG: phytoene/squalene synthase family protein [Cyclobacteriaceae bacterium]